MLLKDGRIPKSLSKQQQRVLEKELKPTILDMFQLTGKNNVSKEKQAKVTTILTTLNQYLGDSKLLTTNIVNYHVSTQRTHTIISQLSTELKPNLLTVTNLEVVNLVILSTSTVLEAFEEVLGYLTQFKHHLDPKGDVYYIVPLNENDFALYRFSLDTLARQYSTLANANIL